MQQGISIDWGGHCQRGRVFVRQPYNQQKKIRLEQNAQYQLKKALERKEAEIREYREALEKKVEERDLNKDLVVAAGAAVVP